MTGINALPDTIYVLKPIGMDGPLKIGCTCRLEDRLREIGAWSPLPLELVLNAPGDKIIERKLHRKYRQHRSHGEWFVAADELLADIAALKSGVSVESLVTDVKLPMSHGDRLRKSERAA